jgi:hypothetical protein
MSFEYLKSKFERVSKTNIKELIVQIWNYYGYTVERNRKYQDSVAVVVASRTHPYPRKEVIQVEHNRRSHTTVDDSLIQQTSALRKQENADNVILVATGSLTKDIKSLAKDLDVVIVDFDQLCSTVDSADLYPTIAEYVEVDDSRDQQLHLETLVDRITANTAIDSGDCVYEELLEIFSHHQSSPRIYEQATLNAFVESDSKHGWQHSTKISWANKPTLDADEIAKQLVEGLSGRSSPNVEAAVLSTVIEAEISENIVTPLKEASISELAEWYVDEFDEAEVPLVGKDELLAVDIAEDVINPNESVASNKLRVAGKLNLRYDDRYETS